MLASKQRDWLFKRTLLFILFVTPLTLALLNFIRSFCTIYCTQRLQVFVTIVVSLLLIIVLSVTGYFTLYVPYCYIHIVCRLLVALHGKNEILIKTGTLTRKEYKHLNNFMCWLISNPPTEISGGIDFLTKHGEFKFFL